MSELIETMGVPKTVILQDPISRNTHENAVNTKQIMDSQGIKRILLVTSAMHMPRSLMIFKKVGVEAIPAPTDFLSSQQNIQEMSNTTEGKILNALPEAERLRNTTRALKEYVGIFFYRLRGWA